MSSSTTTINLPYPNTVPLGSVLTVSGSSTTSGTIQINNGTHWNTLSTDMNKGVEDRLEKIEERLSILIEPSPEILEKHKTLKRAYEEYKMLEKLILGGNHE